MGGGEVRPVWPVQAVVGGSNGGKEVMTAAKMLGALSLWYGLWVAVEVWL